MTAAGVVPIAVLGGATGRIGDPSGKREDRPELALATIEQNLRAIKLQVASRVLIRLSLRRYPSLKNHDEVQCLH